MPNGIEDELEEMLDEVLSAAASLRKAAHAAPHSRRLSVPARGVLTLLRQRPGLTVPQLARQRGTSRQNIQAQVDRLFAAGQVQRIANPDHARSERLQLTPAGRRSLGIANAHRTTLLGKMLPHVTEEEVQSCISVLKRITGHLGSREPTLGPPDGATRRRLSQNRESAPKARAKSEGQGIAEPTVDLSSPGEFPVNLL